MTDLLELALNDLVPNFTEEQPDWTDVLARSTRSSRLRPSPSWRRHPRRTVALALALVLIALLATPAFGVQGYVLHLLGRKNVSFTHSPTAPNVVKKQFLDLPIGAPSQWATPVQAAKARTVATFTIAGHPRKLWVAPTRAGGYCYTFELSFGGCRQTRADRAKAPLGVTWQGGSLRHGVNESIITRVGGDITAPAAAKITARYADGTTADIPFVWVSAPIAAGFFTNDIPTAHWNKQHRLLALTLYSKNGTRLGRQAFQYTAKPVPVRIPIPPSRVGTPKQRVLPTTPDVTPSAPLQQGSADGFRVVVGHNGSVQFTQISETPILKELVGKSAGFSCFRLTREFGIFSTRGLGQGGRYAPKVGFSLNGVGTPVDGCEVQASIGRTWPDRLHNRAAVEIPLTTKGSAYFADRQAARDLALFVRSRRMHQLRKEPAAQAKADILRAYDKPLAHSAITITVVDPATLQFTERSSTGKTFSVTIHNGRISKQNLKPYGFVF
ncbi:MAG: hypothetical protein WAU41_14065 [Gaiellaceae bacterium]